MFHRCQESYMKSYTEISDQVAGGELIKLIVRDPAARNRTVFLFEGAFLFTQEMRKCKATLTKLALKINRTELQQAELQIELSDLTDLQREQLTYCMSLMKHENKAIFTG